MDNLPNTYIIGAQKAGTTTLHDWLIQHPDIFGVSELKDVDFFTHPERSFRAKEMLEAAFRKHESEPIILHSCVNYLLYKKAISNISKLSPGAKIIIILRNPIDRAISAYNYFKKLQKEQRSLTEALLYKPQGNLEFSRYNNDCTYIEHGLYYEQLKNLLKEFPSEQILLLDFKDMKERPEDLLRTVFEFLGVSENFKTDLKIRNITGDIKNQSLHKFLFKSSGSRKNLMQLLNKIGITAQRRQLLKKRLIDLNTTSKKAERRQVADGQRELEYQLYLIFKQDVYKLDELLDENFSYKWFSNYTKS